MGWSRTSFYIKSTAPFADIKVSLHGDDPRHKNPFFKVGLDQPPGAETLPSGREDRREGGLPLVFPGVEISKDVVHAVRIRTTWDLFQRPNQSAPPPKSLRARNYGGRIPAPHLGRAVDVDLFVSRTRPYWPEERDLANNNAGMGPLRNDADDFLTAAVFHRSTALHPTPAHALNRERSDNPVLRRGLGWSTDGTSGLLWIVEQMLDVGQTTVDP